MTPLGPQARSRARGPGRTLTQWPRTTAGHAAGTGPPACVTVIIVTGNSGPARPPWVRVPGFGRPGRLAPRYAQARPTGPGPARSLADLIRVMHWPRWCAIMMSESGWHCATVKLSELMRAEPVLNFLTD